MFSKGVIAQEDQSPMIRVFDLNINGCLIVTSRIELRFALYVYNVCETRSAT